ncbi:phage tail tube protein [Endozoicomonas sp. 2B-B]
MSTIDRSFIGAGSIHIQPYDKSAPLLPIGNVSEFNFSFEEDRKELKNYLGGGGNRNVISRVSGITANLVAHDFTASNISLALRGSVTEAAITPVTDEAQETYGVAGELIPFQRLPDLSQAITVKDSLDTILVEGDDYQLMKSGIQVIEGGGIDDQGIKVSYTPLKANMVQALVESGREFTLFMEGLNDAQEGLPFNIRVHRVKFSPVQNLGFISDDFASIPLQVDVLADTAISGNGLSSFMQLDLAG